MKELTKEQKIEILQHTLRELRRDITFLCSIISYRLYEQELITYDDYYFNKNTDIAIIAIPELSKVKPKDTTTYGAWWKSNDIHSRVNAVNTIINMINNQ